MSTEKNTLENGKDPSCLGDTDSELFELSFENYISVAPLIENDIISEYDTFINRCNTDIEFRNRWLGISL